MITEDYVSFETAKLLKEKGFNENTDKQFNSDKIVGDYNITDRSRYPERYLDDPTLQMVMRWLREVHNLHIEVYRTACGYLYIISKVPTGSDLYDDGDAYDGDDEDSGQWTTCEKATEAAIKYCLENLI